MSYQKIQLVEIGMTDLMEAIRSIIRSEINDLKRLDPSDETLITRKEAAAKLGVCTLTLSKYVKLGYIPAIPLGGKIMFKKSEVLSALKSVQTQKNRR